MCQSGRTSCPGAGRCGLGGVRCGGVSFRTPLTPSLATRNSNDTGPNSVAMSLALVTAPGRAHLAGMASNRCSSFPRSRISECRTSRMNSALAQLCGISPTTRSPWPTGICSSRHASSGDAWLPKA